MKQYPTFFVSEKPDASLALAIAPSATVITLDRAWEPETPYLILDPHFIQQEIVQLTGLLPDNSYRVVRGIGGTEAHAHMSDTAVHAAWPQKSSAGSSPSSGQSDSNDGS